MRVAGWTKGFAGIAPTFRYWMQTEVHVYAFSVAANDSTSPRTGVITVRDKTVTVTQAGK